MEKKKAYTGLVIGDKKTYKKCEAIISAMIADIVLKY